MVEKGEEHTDEKDFLRELVHLIHDYDYLLKERIERGKWESTANNCESEGIIIGRAFERMSMMLELKEKCGEELAIKLSGISENERRFLEEIRK